MFIQIRNTGRHFSRKLNFFAKSSTKTETFRKNHPDKKISGGKLSRKKIFLHKLSRKQKFLRKLSQKQTFLQYEISQQVSEFSLIFAFRKNEMGFRFNPKYRYCTINFKNACYTVYDKCMLTIWNSVNKYIFFKFFVFLEGF
jgi:hypothetical protein